MSKNVHVVGSDPFNQRVLERMRRKTDYRFHSLMDYETVFGSSNGDVERLLDLGVNRLERCNGGLDGIVAYWDFPAQSLAAALRSRLDLPTPSLTSVLKCEHKYWSRLEQRRLVPELVPGFHAFDPWEEDPLDRIPFGFPFWVKPVQGTNSELAFRVEDDEELSRALARIRRKISRIADSFDPFLSRVELPREVAEVTGSHCIAEEVLTGDQATVSGYVHGGRARAYGVVDSVNYPGTSSFFRYQYPSRLPEAVRRRMIEAARKVVEGIGFDDGAFNAEFFYDAEEECLSLLEINPRISQSHGPIYEAVDGAPNHRVMVDLAVGRAPEFPHGQGRSSLAAKFYVRAFRDGRVVRLPTGARVRSIERRIPAAIVDLKVRRGDRLSEMPKQDGYSFELAHVYLGAESEDELLTKYGRVVEMLDIRIDEGQDPPDRRREDRRRSSSRRRRRSARR